jgi:protein gp37
MNYTKIDWCTMSWNPVTGCKYGCPYCYALKQAVRFGEHSKESKQKIHVLDEPVYKEKLHYDNGCADITISITPPEVELKRVSYPFGFEPTFHRYRLEELQHYKKPQNVFIGSMTDLFGAWVPDEWIQEVFKTCEAVPQHRYLFLTKNPARYIKLYKKNLLPARHNFWYGTTTVTEKNRYWYSEYHNFFVSIEPIMSRFSDFFTEVQRIVGAPLFLPWLIVGAETGNRKEKITPKRSWIEDIIRECRRTRTPIFMKDSLAPIWGEPLIQEYPWEGGNL